MNGLNLPTYLAQRREEIGVTKADLLAKVGQIQAELNELDRELAAIDVAEMRYSAPQSSGTKNKATIKEMALEILRAEPQGLTTPELSRKIYALFGVEVGKPSLSPQLSRLKAAGRVRYLDKSNRWLLRTDTP